MDMEMVMEEEEEEDKEAPILEEKTLGKEI